MVGFIKSGAGVARTRACSSQSVRVVRSRGKFKQLIDDNITQCFPGLEMRQDMLKRSTQQWPERLQEPPPAWQRCQVNEKLLQGYPCI